MIVEKQFRSNVLVRGVVSVFLMLLWSSVVSGQQPASITIQTSSDAKISVNGKGYGTSRKLNFKDMATDADFEYRVRATFENGQVQERRLFLAGGRHAVVDFRSSPELVPQPGGNYNAIVSPSGKYILYERDNTAVLRDAESGLVLREYRAHSKRLEGFAFSSDESKVYTAGMDDRLITWELQTGKVLRDLDVPSCYGFCLAGNHSTAVLATSDDCQLMDVHSGRVIRTFDRSGMSFYNAWISPKAQFVVGQGRISNGAYGGVIWDARTGAELHSLGSTAYYTPAFNTDETLVVTIADDDRRLQCRESRSGQLVWEATGKSYSTVVYDANKNQFLAVGSNRQDDAKPYDQRSYWLEAFNLRSSTPLLSRSMPGHCELLSPQHDVALINGKRMSLSQLDAQSPDAYPESLLTSTRQPFWLSGGRVVQDDKVFHLGTGQLLHDFNEGGDSRLFVESVSGDGSRIFCFDSREVDYKTIYVFSSETYRLLQRIRSPFKSLHLRPDHAGSRLAAGFTQWYFFGVSSKSVFNGGTSEIDDPNLSPDGKRTYHSDRLGEVIYLKEFETKRGVQKNLSTSQLESLIRGITPSSDGKYIAVCGTYRNLARRSEEVATLWILDPLTLAIQKIIKDSEIDEFGAVVVSPDSRRIACVEGYPERRKSVVVYDAATGRRLMETVGHYPGYSDPPAFSPDGKFLLTVSEAGWEFWDIDRQEKLATWLNFESQDESDSKNHWLVFTPQGAFDGTSVGRKQTTFRVGDRLKVVAADRFFQDLYRPGLLPRLLGGENIDAPTDFAQQQAPKVEMLSPSSRSVVNQSQVEIKARFTDLGGGIARPWVFHNGSRVLVDGNWPADGRTREFTFSLALVEGDNSIEVFSASEDKSWESDPAQIVIRHETPMAQPTLHLVAVGVSQYAQETMNLKFAAIDADSIATIFDQRGPALYGQDRVRIVRVNDQQATRQGILTAIDEVAKASNPQDTFVLFLAGHGSMVGQRYYFLPHDFEKQSDNLEEDIRRQGLPGDELNDALASVAARRRVMIYDTCQSGGAIQLARTARNGLAFRGALERMSRATGSYIIAATSASAEAHEIEDLGHGVLSYTLLAGAGAEQLKGPLRSQPVVPQNSKTLDVRDWFNYAQDKVPGLTKLYLGEEQFVEANASGSNFPILPLSK
ncbi:caspase family protein [Stieleria varia]|nr:caspase family protein [Stieleria varia]